MGFYGLFWYLTIKNIFVSVCCDEMRWDEKPNLLGNRIKITKPREIETTLVFLTVKLEKEELWENIDKADIDVSRNYRKLCRRELNWLDKVVGT